jgi:hypothetical protein
MKKSNRLKIPTIIGILILVVGLATGVLLIQNKQIFNLGAQVSNPPKDVRVTNITDSSFTITWTTQSETSGFIVWGDKISSLDKTESDEIKSKGYTHSATIKGLSQSKTYYFKINSGGAEYDNNKIPWEVTTGPQLSSPDKSITISGNVLTATGTPASSAIVYVSIGGASPSSTTTSENGSWVIPLSQTRNANLNSYYPIKDSDLVEISVQAGPSGISSAQIYLPSAKPVPPMILGQTHDFKNLPAGKNEELPTSNLELPADIEKGSRFDVSDAGSTPSSKTVTLDSVDEGEVVTSTKPEFFGEAPPSTNVTITVESDLQSDVITVGTTGNWKWSPPENLEPGTHKITINWRDENGILKSLVRTFVVQAAEGPAFVSTPSATLTPSPLPTATAKASASPSSTQTPTKPTSTASASATPKTPVSGLGLPTVVLLGAGFLLLILGAGMLFSKEENV